MRPRWNSASPLTTPATCQRAMPKASPKNETASVSHAGGPETTRSANGSATTPRIASTSRASRIELCTTKTRSRAGPSAASPHATVADAPLSLAARATSAPGRSRTSEAPTRRSQSPTPSAGSSRATPSKGSERRRIGAPLARRRSAHTTVPFVGELTQAGPFHGPGIARVQAHAPAEARVGARHGRQRRAGQVLRSCRKRRDSRAHATVMLLPVAVPAPPHLVDAPVRNPRAELRLVVDNGRRREVVRLPAGLPQPILEVDLLGIEEEAFVEQPHLLERL